ncbi:MAG TPA: rhomboid family intramembrane serine protease [Vicinamibacteria bacterium]|nr:rhomboid family intramembrane serine protease [Vicinamibacteria bacterium]
MFQRQKEGSVLCASCNRLVGVNDEKCLNCGRRNPGLYGFGAAIRALGRDFGFVKLVITGSIGLFIATLLVDPSGIRQGGFLTFMSPSTRALFLFGASGQFPVFELGRWWTLLSAGWLHGGLLHIAFNMMIVRNFAPATAEFYGAGRMIIIYSVSSITGFFFSSLASQLYPFIPFGFVLSFLGLAGAPLTLGASAPIFGLLGALLYYGRRTGSRVIQQQMIGYAVFFGIFGIVMPGVDNQAHLGGLVGGYLMARFLDPLEPERGDHLLVGLVFIVLTALSIVVSVVAGMPYIPYIP